MRVYALQGDTVDAICWRYYGRTQGVVEQVYSLNEGAGRCRGRFCPTATRSSCRT